jgi:TRAP-type C4-dicarboxylate transport system permease small subunit
MACGFAFFVVFAIMVLEVFNRFFDVFDIRWSEEVARSLLTWIVFLGFGLSTALDQNIKADLTGSIEVRWLRNGLRFLSLTCSFLFLLGMLLVGVQLVQVSSNMRMVSVDFSRSLVVAAVPAGAALGLIITAIRLAIGRKRPIEQR